MQELIERDIDSEGRVGSTSAGHDRVRGRTVTVNVAENPLGWLSARGMIDRRQLEAGERLRADYERASLGARVTMRWDPAGHCSAGRKTAEDHHPSIAALSAKRRFDAAVVAVGPGLNEVLWRVVCAGEGLASAEKGLGWPSRAGKIVLVLALDRLAAHYGLP